MTTKRIRCSCGRIYDPIKREVCPDCGASPAAAVVAPVPTSAPTPDPIIAVSPAPGPRRKPPLMLATGAGAAALLILIFILGRRGPSRVEPQPAPAVAAAQTPAPSRPTAIPAPAPSLAPEAGKEFDLAAAIARAAPGATIKIPAGAYPGPLAATRPVRLEGPASGPVFIQSQGRECLTVSAKGVFAQNIQFVCQGVGDLAAVSIAPGAELELEACKVQSGAGLGIISAGTLKANGGSFATPSGFAIRLNAGQASLTQCSILDSRTGLGVANGVSAELHSCAFERNGAGGLGAVAIVTGAQASLKAGDCRFTSNTGGIRAEEAASLTIEGSAFDGNGAEPRAVASLGLVVLFNNARGAVTGCTFGLNQQGLASVNGSQLVIEKCQISGGGVQGSQMVLCQPVSTFGKDAVVTISHSVITDSANCAIQALAGGKAILEDVEISGSRSVGLAVGDPQNGAGQAEARHSRFLHNATGIGLVAGSVVTLEDSELRDNQDGVILNNQGSIVHAARLTVSGNSDAGVFVRSNAQAEVTDSEFTNNARAAIAGVRGRPAERPKLTLKNCRINGSRIFGVGSCVGSQVSLSGCTFDDTGKQNIYQERGASLEQTADDMTDDSDATSPSSEGDTPNPASSPSSRRRDHSKSPPRSNSRPHPPTPDEIRRTIHRFLPGF